MSPCGERKNLNSCDGENFWGSDYGNELDIMAPGVLIPTTDRQGTNGYNPQKEIITIKQWQAIADQQRKASVEIRRMDGRILKTSIVKKHNIFNCR